MAGQLLQPFYNLHNILCRTTDGALNPINISFKRKPKYATKQTGLVPQQVYIGEDFPDISIEIYNDNNNNFATILPNKGIAGFVLTSNQDGGAQVLPADLLAMFPPSTWVFGDPETGYDLEKNSTTKFNIRSNVLNPGVGGGFTSGSGTGTGTGTGV